MFSRTTLVRIYLFIIITFIPKIFWNYFLVFYKPLIRYCLKAIFCFFAQKMIILLKISLSEEKKNTLFWYNNDILFWLYAMHMGKKTKEKKLRKGGRNFFTCSFSEQILKRKGSSPGLFMLATFAKAGVEIDFYLLISLRKKNVNENSEIIKYEISTIFLLLILSFTSTPWNSC